MQPRRHVRSQVLDYNLTPSSRAVVRRAYRIWRQAQGMPYRCDNAACQMHVSEPQWNGHPIVLTLDHVDGNSRTIALQTSVSSARTAMHSYQHAAGATRAECETRVSTATTSWSETGRTK